MPDSSSKVMATLVLTGSDLADVSWLPLGWILGPQASRTGEHILTFTSPPPVSITFSRKEEVEIFLQLEARRKRAAPAVTAGAAKFGPIHSFYQCYPQCSSGSSSRSCSTACALRFPFWPADTVPCDREPPGWLPHGWRLACQ